MKKLANRGLALLMAFVMIFSLMPVMEHTAHAANETVEYVYSGNYIYNWGSRGTTATFLSPNAENFYTGNYTYENLSQLSRGTSTATAPSSDLYKALQALMESNHSYETSYDATKDLYQYTDCQNSGGKISSFYSGAAIGPGWGSTPTWNREHTWPNSKGLGGNDENDIMMLRPTAQTENSSRGNDAYGESSGYYHPNSESDGKYDLRGDVARIFLYVYVRWGNVNGNGEYSTWGSRGVIESQEVLLNWMAADPVDTWELGRNDSVESITGTRNVFVDYPELAFLLFGEEVPADMITPSGIGSGSSTGHKHDYTMTVTTAPTCTAAGACTYTCECGSSYAGVIEATGHSYANGACSICGAKEPAGFTATLVTSTADLSVGDQIVIVAKDYGYAMSTEQKTNNRNQTDITKSADGSSVTFTADSAVQIFTLKAGTKTGTYAFDVGNGYLYAASSSKNYLRTGTTLTDDSSFKITIADGIASVVAQGTNSINILKYNTSGLFSCYGTGNVQKDISIYRIGSGSSEGTPECDHSYTSSVTTAATCTTDGVLTYTCQCGDSYTEVIPATGHSYVNGTCTGCGEAEPSAEPTISTTVTLVTDVTDLAVGDQIIIVAKDYNYALSTNQKSNNRGQANIIKNSDGSTITYAEDAGVQIITLENGTASGTFAFNVGNGYLYAASSSKNYLRTETNLSNNSSWSITIADGTATVKAQGTNTRNNLRYNDSKSSGQLFACYTSGQKDIAIYEVNTVCSHSYTSAVTTEPTCTADGVRTFTCQCGDSYTEVIPATGHSYENGTCTGCGEADPSVKPSEPAEPTEPSVVLVTDASDLAVGDQIIIIAKDYDFALSTTQNKNNRGQAAIIRSDDSSTITYADDAGVQVITLEAGTKAGTFAFNVGNGYLYAASKSSNHLKTTTSLTDDASFKITIADGAATVVAQGENSRNILRYNDNPVPYGQLFACYAKGQKDIAIYKITDGSESGDECSHSYTSAVTTEPTCTTDGVRTYTCQCGDSYTETIPATGHSYVDGKCTGCGKSSSEGSDEGEVECTHSYTSTVTTAPTCTTPGLVTYTCECGDSYTQTVVPTGHAYIGGKCVRCGSAAYVPPVIVTPEVTVPTTGNENAAQVEVSVAGSKVTIQDVELTVNGNNADESNASVTIDLSGMNTEISEVAIPADMFDKIADAAVDSTQNMEIILSEGLAIEFNVAALGEQMKLAGGKDLTVSIIPSEEAVLTSKQQETVGQNIAYDINMTSGGKHISDMGGQITVSAPYELKNGEKAGGLVVYYVDENGNRERCVTYYDAETKSVKWNTNHLSLYMLDYDENRTEACDGSATCPVHAFTDAKTDAWYHNGVHYCLANGLMDGIPGNLFDPNGTTTRAQLVTILWRLEGKPVVNYLMQFDDVASDSWYTEAVRWAAAEKIVEGHDGKFDPNGAITREQLATILYRYEQYKGGGFTGTWMFLLDCTDRDKVSNWAYEAMCWMSMNGVITGTDGALNPKNNATRAQIAMTLYRYCEATGKED